MLWTQLIVINGLFSGLAMSKWPCFNFFPSSLSQCGVEAVVEEPHTTASPAQCQTWRSLQPSSAAADKP